MTTQETLRVLKQNGKPCSLAQLYRYFERLDIKPAGYRQRPQRYPADTAERILAHLGFTAPAGGVSTPVPRNVSRRPVKLVTLAQLRAARKTTKKKGK